MPGGRRPGSVRAEAGGSAVPGGSSGPAPRCRMHDSEPRRSATAAPKPAILTLRCTAPSSRARPLGPAPHPAGCGTVTVTRGDTNARGQRQHEVPPPASGRAPPSPRVASNWTLGRREATVASARPGAEYSLPQWGPSASAMQRALRIQTRPQSRPYGTLIVPASTGPPLNGSAGGPIDFQQVCKIAGQRHSAHNPTAISTLSLQPCASATPVPSDVAQTSVVDMQRPRQPNET